NEPRLNAAPKEVNCGKAWKWQDKQAAPVWRANAGTASEVVGAAAIADTATTAKAAAEKIVFFMLYSYEYKFDSVEPVQIPFWLTGGFIKTHSLSRLDGRMIM
ncbi:MAG: hypothetical protein Q9M16_02515, partial [Mariprofundus sp.]|nr:hypothetical protein [Mariprofundus sp.]